MCFMNESLIYVIIYIGYIPSAFGCMTGLRFLNLKANRLSGTIPASLGFLTSLEQLVFAFNSLGGPIPSELSLLSQLQMLDVSHNFLTGVIPTTLCELEVEVGFSFLSSDNANYVTGGCASADDRGICALIAATDVGSSNLTTVPGSDWACSPASIPVSDKCEWFGVECAFGTVSSLIWDNNEINGRC